MACDSFLTYGPRALLGDGGLPSVAFGNYDSLVENAIGAQGIFGCPGLVTLFNVLYAGQPNSGFVANDAVIPLAGISFTSTFPTEVDIPLKIDGVGYGSWHISNPSGTQTVTNNTTFGPTITMTTGIAKNVFIGGSGILSVGFPLASALTSADAAQFVPCAVPACGIGPPPPGPPFPPFLPPSSSWPTITPAPTPPTPSFETGQFANQVMGIAANYSIFSNFGYKG